MFNMNEVTEIQKNEVSNRITNEFIDAVEWVMVNEMVGSGEFVLIQAPLEHKFVKGAYIRKITMPPHSRFTSVIHNTEHPYFILRGVVSVFSENDGAQFLVAPYYGITTPGTRRVLHVHEETVWITVHPTDVVPEDDSEEAIEKAADLVMSQITLDHENKLLGGRYKNSVFTPSLNEVENEK